MANPPCSSIFPTGNHLKATRKTHLNSITSAGVGFSPCTALPAGRWQSMKKEKHTRISWGFQWGFTKNGDFLSVMKAWHVGMFMICHQQKGWCTRVFIMILIGFKQQTWEVPDSSILLWFHQAKLGCHKEKKTFLKPIENGNSRSFMQPTKMGYEINLYVDVFHVDMSEHSSLMYIDVYRGSCEMG